MQQKQENEGLSVDEIEELENILDALLRGVQETLQTGEMLSNELQAQIAEEINYLTSEIDTLYSQRQQAQAPEGAPPVQPTPLGPAPSPSAQLMWILAGQNESAFVSYLQSYPDTELQSLLLNPAELTRTINFLSQMMPPGQQPQADGIEHAPLNSSNIYGFKYNPKTQRLLVRFQGGSIYGYNGVPANVFNAFQSGARAAQTNGQNKYGRWWVGKLPSLGAAFYQLIRNGGYSYQRLS
jgi:hypothetical protein